MLRRIFPGIYEGWLVVGSAAVTTLLIGASFFYGFGTIFNEVKDEFGWTTAMTSLTPPMNSSSALIRLNRSVTRSAFTPRAGTSFVSTTAWAAATSRLK